MLVSIEQKKFQSLITTVSQHLANKALKPCP